MKHRGPPGAWTSLAVWSSIVHGHRLREGATRQSPISYAEYDNSSPAYREPNSAELAPSRLGQMTAPNLPAIN